MRLRSIPFTASALLLLPLVARAADSAAPDLGGSVLQLVFGFVLILALLLATLWLLKKVSVPRGGAGALVRVVSAAAVGPRERVVVVDVAGKRLVLGVAPGQVSLLDAQQHASGALPDSGNAVQPVAPDFAQRLKRLLAKRNEM